MSNELPNSWSSVNSLRDKYYEDKKFYLRRNHEITFLGELKDSKLIYMDTEFLIDEKNKVIKETNPTNILFYKSLIRGDKTWH